MTDRFLLYIDILGFTDIVRKEPRKVARIYSILYSLNVHKHNSFKTIVFSDTVLVLNRPAEGVTMSWGEQILPAKVVAAHLHPNKRIRLGAVTGGDHWFRYDNKGNSTTRFADTAREVQPYLSGEASDHWAKGPLPDTKSS